MLDLNLSFLRTMMLSMKKPLVSGSHFSMWLSINLIFLFSYQPLQLFQFPL